MRVTSPDFDDGQPLPPECAYQADNKRPTLELSDVTDRTVSLAVMVHDPDAPNGDFTHWLAWNFPPHITNIPGNSIPNEVTEGTNDMNQIGWVGPAPPSGTHHYHFVVYALSCEVNLPPETTKGKFVSAITKNILEQAEIVGTFSAD